MASLYQAWKYRRRIPKARDIQAPVFRIPHNCLHIFLLDVSDSMAATFEIVQRWAAKVLSETYLRRDPVTFLTVQGKKARILTPPTTSIQFLLHRLSKVTEGGGTPLRQGLRLTDRVIRQWRDRYPAIKLVMVTDGRSTQPLDDMERPLRSIHRHVQERIVVNPVPHAAPFAQAFADLLKARCLTPEEFLRLNG